MPSVASSRNRVGVAGGFEDDIVVVRDHDAPDVGPEESRDCRPAPSPKPQDAKPAGGNQSRRSLTADRDGTCVAQRTMGWYIRKSARSGPVRVNVSTSGVGASVGVKGARIGIGPRGPYVAGGLGGLYFMQRLGSLGTPNVQFSHRLVRKEMCAHAQRATPQGQELVAVARGSTRF
jgi:hypothetical protein